LTLTLPPWHLPITALRWGRWHDAGVLETPNLPPVRGQAIHELVRLA